MQDTNRYDARLGDGEEAGREVGTQCLVGVSVSGFTVRDTDHEFSPYPATLPLRLIPPALQRQCDPLHLSTGKVQAARCIFLCHQDSAPLHISYLHTPKQAGTVSPAAIGSERQCRPRPLVLPSPTYHSVCRLSSIHW